MADLVQTAANVGLASSGAVLSSVQVGEAVTQGQPGYLNAADSKYYKGDCDASAAAAAAKGVFLTAAALDGYAVLATSGPIDLGATLTVGETYVVSDTAGGIKPIADLVTGDYVTYLGVASAAGRLNLSVDATGVAVP